MIRWIVMLLISVVLIGGVLGFNVFKQKMIADYFANMPAPTFPVTAEPVRAQDWQPRIEAIGFIEPSQGVMVRSEAAGVIRKLGFESGVPVQAGDLLVALDTSVEEANLKAAQAKLPATKSQFERMSRLYKEKSVSKGQLDEAEAAYRALQAEIESLQATIARRTIRAPFDGIVGLRDVFLGQYLQNGSDVVRLEDNQVMRIRFTISQNDLSRIEEGQDVAIQVDAYPDKRFEGQITAIEPVVNAESGVVQVQASIPNNSGELRSGMFAKVAVSLPRLADQVVIPQTAINFTLYGQTVYLVEENEEGVKTARQVTVEVADRRGDVARISHGLAPGMTLVTSGQVRLYNGAQVKLVEDASLAGDKPLPKL
ncbi:efflux RND transporter periplasmic adaptor subunit [Gallaecimonas sp. GXIMD4217]|uniref:efflux RND transporter periplasmic adaptor subunit n=1 Tax=Gallaecimonas sp. GXIMD4217 TaxID=3131927 RepID=UPI00311B3961